MVFRIIFTLLLFVSIPSSPETLTTYTPNDKTLLLGSNSGCKFENLKSIKEFLVYSVKGTRGKELDVAIDKENKKTSQFDLVINSPEKPVALLLESYNEAIWNISWTKRTKIVAIIATGYHRQIVTGISESTPLIISTYDNKHECGYISSSSSDKREFNSFSKKVLTEEPYLYLNTNQEITLIGEQFNINEKILQSNYIKLKDILENETYFVGIERLKRDLNHGYIRELKKQEIDAWLTQYREKLTNKDQEISLPGVYRNGTNTLTDDQFGRRPFKLDSIYNGYVIQKEYTLPKDLNGIESATFFLLKGIPFPKGDLGHSTIFDFNTMSCTGFECPEKYPTTTFIMGDPPAPIPDPVLAPQ